MKTENEFLGKPIEYWLEMDSEINKYIINKDLFTTIVSENHRLRVQNNKLSERLDLVKHCLLED